MRLKNSRLWVKHRPWVVLRDSSAILLVAFTIRYAIHGLIEPYAPFHFFIVACLAIAIRYGYKAACLSLLASTFLGSYYFVAPYETLGAVTMSDLIQAFNFFFVTIISIVVIETLQRTIYAQHLLLKIMKDRQRAMLFRQNELAYKLREFKRETQ